MVNPTLPPVGSRIALVEMLDDPDPIPVGTTGTVTRTTPDQITVEWDIPRSLCLIVGVDRWMVLDERRTSLL